MMTGFSKKCKKFADGGGYLVVSSALALLMWWSGQEIAGVALTAILLCFGLLFGDTVRPILSTALLLIVSISAKQIFSHMTAFIIVCAVSLVGVAACLAIFLRRKLRAMKSEGRRFTGGAMLVPMLVAIVGVALCGLFYPDQTIELRLMLIGVCVAMILYYLLFRNISDGITPKYVAWLFIAFGAVVALETMLYYLMLGSGWAIMESFKLKTLEYGWGKSNSAGIILVIASLMSIYLCFKSKRDYFFVILAFVFLIAMLFTFSRGSIAVGIVLIPIAGLITLIKSSKRDRWRRLITILTCVAVTCIVITPIVPILWNIFGIEFVEAASTGSRIEIYKICFKAFLDKPIFGIGYLSWDTSLVFLTYKGASTIAYYAHSTVLNVLACSGIFGALTILPYFIVKYKVFLVGYNKHWNEGENCDISFFKTICFISMLSIALYGLIDIMFLSIYYHMMLFIMLISCEKLNKSVGENDAFRFFGRLPCDKG